MTRRLSRILGVLAVLALVAAGCSGDDAAPSATDASTTTAAPATTTTTLEEPARSGGCLIESPGPLDGEPVTVERSVMSGGIERPYLITYPAGGRRGGPIPLVLAFHALNVPNTFVAAGSGLPEASEQRPFVTVAPSGRLDGATPYWNAAPVDPNVDVTFVADLLDHLEADVCFDTNRVIALGMSNGAEISSLLACRLPDRLLGIGAIAGVEYPGFPGDCDGGPIPVIAFHGDADPIVLYEGGGLNATKIADIQEYKGDVPPGLPDPIGVDASMDEWAASNGCDPEPAEERLADDVVHRTWSGCEAATELYVLEGGGHQWPGRPMPSFDEQFGPGTDSIDATAIILDALLGPAA